MSHHVETFIDDDGVWGWQCFEPGCQMEATGFASIDLAQIDGDSHLVSRPSCWDDCSTVLRNGMADMGSEVTVSPAPPLIQTPYTTEAFICPHGVRYWLEPTGEQIAQWTRDGVE